MSGLALIDAGSRPIIWIWTHKAIDAVRLWLGWCAVQSVVASHVGFCGVMPPSATGFSGFDAA